MYLELDTKFYEISMIKNTIYIHYGKIPSMETRLPFGKLIKYEYNDKAKRESFYNDKVNNKLKKGYEVIKSGKTPTNDMKEMIRISKKKGYK